MHPLLLMRWCEAFFVIYHEASARGQIMSGRQQLKALQVLRLMESSVLDLVIDSLTLTPTFAIPQQSRSQQSQASCQKKLNNN